MFQFDRDLRPVKVAGVPPDYFQADGQLWGNPLYNWKKPRFKRFNWWIERLRGAAARYDLLRIDHFIGFANYYAIPAGAPNARGGSWVKAPGKKLFKKVKKELPQLRIIAEDLGEVNQRVRDLLEDCGFPGMKVLQFGFGGEESNIHLPQNIPENCAFYTGTHDNDPIAAYWEKASEEEKAFVHQKLGEFSDEEAPAAFIKAVMESKADLAVIPVQDLLGLGKESRMNYPGTLGGNWLWRLTEEQFKEMKEKASLLYTLLKEADRT